MATVAVPCWHRARATLLLEGWMLGVTSRWGRTEAVDPMGRLPGGEREVWDHALMFSIGTTLSAEGVGDFFEELGDELF